MANPVFSQPVDQQALALTHAIALQESGHGGKPNYDAVGDNGTSHGAYQWQPGNYEAAAKEAGLDPADRSPESQDKVAYYQVKKYKDQGLDPGQIASKWNSGSPDNWKDHKGTTIINGKPISYDTPAYVQGVKAHYQQLMPSQGGYQTQPAVSAPTGVPEAPQEQTLGSKLQGRVQDASHGLGLATQGGIGNIAQGALQAVGAGAGAVGDIAQKGLEFIPGVKSLEGALGGLVGDAANTPLGQSVVSTAQQFTQQHPELAKDIGAVGNIASVIPLFKGVGLAADAVKTGASKAFEGSLAGMAEKELTGATSATISGRTALGAAQARGIEPVKEIISKRYIPTITDGKYDFAPAYEKAKADMTTLEDNYQKLLDTSAATGNVADKIPVETVRKAALADVERELSGTGNVKAALKKVNNIFDENIKQKGDLISLSDLNAMKRKVRESVNFKSSNLESGVAYNVGQSLQNAVESYGEKAGVAGIKEANKQMAHNIEARKFMKMLNGKSPKVGKLGKVLREGSADVAGGAGELAGNMVGLPFVGALGGRALGRGIAGGGKGTVLKLLSRAQERAPAQLAKRARTAPLVGLRNSQEQ